MELNLGQRLALAIDMHLILDAGAGTGKTQSIVGRAIEHYLSVDQRATRLLPAGPRPAPLSGGALRIGLAEREDLAAWQGLLPSEVVVLTFTTRAAEEMRHRLWAELNRLRPGPTRDDGGERRDARVTQDGLIDQLTAMLEDAPIGTIDAFLSRLIAPWRADLAERPTEEIVSDAERHVLTDRALDGLWRLRSAGDAVDAGVSGERAAQLVTSRDRLARRFGSRSAMRKVLSSLLSNRVFVDNVARRLETGGSVDAADVNRLIVDLLSPADAMFDAFVDEIHTTCENWLNLARIHQGALELSAGLSGGLRFETFDELITAGPPATRWERYLWVHALCLVTCTASSHTKNEVSAFSGGNLVHSADWPRGIQTWGKVKDAAAKERAKALGAEIADLWNAPMGQSYRPIARALFLLDDTPFPVPNLPADSAFRPLRLSSPLPYGPPDGLRTFGLEEEACHLQDLLLCHRALLDLLHELKVREGVHEFDDVASLAGDLLLARCPRIMRGRYPVEVVRALDALPDDPWRDDHIVAALALMEGFTQNPELAALTAEESTRLFEDLQARFARLREIRARYRAFIIDEAQDNSAQQWRLLGRLWGERELPAGHPVPDTPWQPTVCCVGDRKQSIYAFRQAQVSGFVQFGASLRLTNRHEMASLPALTRAPALRRPESARDPRYVADGGFATASDLPASRSAAEGAWVRFDALEEGASIGSADAVARSEGHVELVVNYRTAAGLLERMNDWWEDLFDESHDRFPGDWYARPQALIPARAEAEGRFEWLLPARLAHEGHPESDLAVPLDPFTSGTTKEMENALIAARIRALLDGATTRVEETAQPDAVPMAPGDILVLLPSRSNLPDLMDRLEAAGIPAIADKEGGLLLRPVVRPLLGLLGWVARPSDRHAAATVARSCLVGLDDAGLQAFLGDAAIGEDLISRLAAQLPEGPHRALVLRWAHHAAEGEVQAALHDTLDHSDLLLAHPRGSERSDAEQFVGLLGSQSAEVGGDAILLADRMAHLADVAGRDLTSSGNATADAVQVMTIHGSKGLQARCVIVGGLFSEGQGNINHDLQDRVLATPGIFAANPRPWLTESSLESGVWTLARRLQEAQVQAEARRLFYVACTRVKDLLILAGGPSDSLAVPGGVSLKVRSLPMPTFGHMWFDALGWEPGEDGRYMIPVASLPFAVHRHVSELGEPRPAFSPLVRMTRLDAAAQYAFSVVEPTLASSGVSRSRRLTIAPHALDAAAACPRRHQMSTRGGLSTEAIRLDMAAQNPADSAAERVGLPPANVVGSIVHRLIEVGLPNPGTAQASVPLPPQWIEASPDRLDDESVIVSVLAELMPPDTDADEVANLMRTMARAIRAGPIGTLCAGGSHRGQTVEGLRTEWPFSVRHTFDVEAQDTTWTPHGAQILAEINRFEFSSNGIADLVLCTRLENGQGAIRAIDLKTTAAAHLHANWAHPLLEASGEERHPAETDLLQHYRMQLALYTRALQRQESARKDRGLPSRIVLPPAILAAATGRLIEMTESEMESALADLDTLLASLADLSLADEEAELPPRLSGSAAAACQSCPFAIGDIRLCAPAGEPLGPRPVEESA